MTVCFVGDEYYLIRENSTDLVLTNESNSKFSPLAGRDYTFRIDVMSNVSGLPVLKMAAYNVLNVYSI